MLQTFPECSLPPLLTGAEPSLVLHLIGQILLLHPVVRIVVRVLVILGCILNIEIPCGHLVRYHVTQMGRHGTSSVVADLTADVEDRSGTVTLWRKRPKDRGVW